LPFRFAEQPPPLPRPLLAKLAKVASVPEAEFTPITRIGIPSGMPCPEATALATVMSSVAFVLPAVAVFDSVSVVPPLVETVVPLWIPGPDTVSPLTMLAGKVVPSGAPPDNDTVALLEVVVTSTIASLGPMLVSAPQSVMRVESLAHQIR
jgi:hypothetical protein